MDPVEQLTTQDISESSDQFETIELDQEDDGPHNVLLPFIQPGCSLEDHAIIFNQKHPTNSKWKDVTAPNICNVSATIDGARQMMWNQARLEIDFVRK
jgi:hypothetical protein